MATERRKRTSKVKGQSSIEYLSTFAATLIILIIVIAIASSLFYNRQATTYSPESCYVSAQINCIQFTVANNGIAAKAVLAFQNNLGQTLYLSSNSFVVTPTYTQSYSGSCLPSNAPQGAFVVCNASLPNYKPGIGAQLNPKFQVIYSQCSNGICNKYNTTGTATVYVATINSLYVSIQLLDVPSNGFIILDGTQYPSNTFVNFIKGTTYNIYVDPQPGYTYSGTLTQGGVLVQNGLSQGTTAVATSNGVIIGKSAPTVVDVVPNVYLTLQSGFDER